MSFTSQLRFTDRYWSILPHLLLVLAIVLAAGISQSFGSFVNFDVEETFGPILDVIYV